MLQSALRQKADSDQPGRAFFLPSTFKAEVNLAPDRLHRGIYESVVYGGTLHLSGIFGPPALEVLGIDPQRVRWDEAQFVLSVSDLRGTKEALSLSVGGVRVPLEPGSGLDGFAAGVHARVKGLTIPAEGMAFDITLNVNGSRGLRFAPVGAANDVGVVIALAFTAFFLFEVLAAVRIHPFQYTLVGAALCLFYLGLLALSEVLSFAAAYWTGAVASTLVIALYSVKALNGGWRAALAGAGLTAVYGFLYVVLRLQDYSLLVGTAGLFVVLVLVMYVTRGIDWYARDER